MPNLVEVGPVLAFDRWNVAAILAMAVVTFACRAGGYWLFRMVHPSPFLRAVLRYVPGTLFISFVTPALVDGGAAQWTGAAVTLAVMLVTRSQSGAIIGGTVAAWAVWGFWR